MSDLWNPDRIWSVDEVRDAIGTQAGLACTSVEAVGCCWDNAAFLVDGEWLFRFAQRRIAIPLLDREWQVMPRLAPRLSLPVPRPQWFGRVGEWSFLGYPRISGLPASDFEIDDTLRFELARPLGKFLRTLHDQPTHDLPVDPDLLGRFDIAMRHPRAVAMLEECDSSIDVAGLRHILDAVDPRPAPTVLSHGDLYSRHLLIDQGQLSGVIDWGDVCLAEPAHDLSLAYCFLPINARQEFFAAYGSITPGTASRSRFRAICHALHVYQYARSIGDVMLLAEATKSFQLIVM